MYLLSDEQSNAKLSKNAATLDSQWDDWRALQQDIQNLESGERVDYYGAEDGIYSFVRFDAGDIPEEHREYFESYLSDRCLSVDWNNDTLSLFLGDDNLIIQDDTRYRRDNGVWQCHKLIIDEQEYRDEETGEIDEQKRNALIESHMERTGCFPGVFSIDRHGNVFPVSTLSKK